MVDMAILKIARMGHPVLVRPAQPIDDPSAEPVQRLIADMAETLVDAEGIGLAAPQVHRSLRLILFFDAEERDEVPGRRPIALINPEIEPLDDALEPGWEGCLSIPGLRGLVPRYARIGYRGVTPEGRTFEREAQRSARPGGPARGGPSGRRALPDAHARSAPADVREPS